MRFKAFEIVGTVVIVALIGSLLRAGLTSGPTSGQNLLASEPSAEPTPANTIPKDVMGTSRANSSRPAPTEHLGSSNLSEWVKQIQADQEAARQRRESSRQASSPSRGHSDQPAVTQVADRSTSDSSSSTTNTSGSSGTSSGSSSSATTSAPSDSRSVPTGGGGFAGSSQGYPQVDENIDHNNPRPTANLSFSNLPSLNSQYSPLAEQNRQALFDRLVEAFDQYYANNFPASRDISNDFRFYFFRQELQAFVDMYHATDNVNYLQTAKDLALKAISDAKNNVKPLYHHSDNRGDFPTFNRSGAPYVFPRHGTELWSGQLNDFQGAAGLMLVATTLKNHGVSGWREIADFVEQNIVEKWLYYRPARNQAHYTGSQSRTYLLGMLDTARDKREHFADICLQLNALGYDKYPYRNWAEFLFEIYLQKRESRSQPYPYAEYRRLVPTNWGVYPQANGALVWRWTSRNTIPDTSHANRTVWIAAEAYETGLIDADLMDGFVLTLKRNIWNPQKGTFFFNDNIDGSLRQDAPGQRGNVWFGWHRLAAYDNDLKDLFISLAYDLTNGGPNITPSNAQNRTFPEAPLCFFAWAARLREHESL